MLEVTQRSRNIFLEPTFNKAPIQALQHYPMASWWYFRIRNFAHGADIHLVIWSATISKEYLVLTVWLKTIRLTISVSKPTT
jgi:hypothetical protein